MTSAWLVIVAICTGLISSLCSMQFNVEYDKGDKASAGKWLFAGFVLLVAAVVSAFLGGLSW